jgi:hypothetical protein
MADFMFKWNDDGYVYDNAGECSPTTVDDELKRPRN